MSEEFEKLDGEQLETAELESLELENSDFEGEAFEDSDLETDSDELPPSSDLSIDEAFEASTDDNELSGYEAVEIEEEEFIEHDHLLSIVESVLFASDRPISLETIKSVFKGTNIKTKDIRRALDELASRYAQPQFGVALEEIGGGYQLRTKIDNANFMKRHVKGRAFKLSGPALEVISIVAYKQPCVKAQVDEIRGVESGHLMRALMDRGLIRFGGKSELPGKPMYYETTRKFLEIFGLRNINELPSLSEIDELIPDGIGDVIEEKEQLSDLTGVLSLQATSTYSEGEGELLKITDQLQAINTSSEFFEKEKARQKRKQEEERAQDIRESMMLGKDVSDADVKWLKRFDKKLEEEKLDEEARVAAATAAEVAAVSTEGDVSTESVAEGESVIESDTVGSETLFQNTNKSQDPIGDSLDFIESETESETAFETISEETGENEPELSDDEILEKVDFEMSETKFTDKSEA